MARRFLPIPPRDAELSWRKLLRVDQLPSNAKPETHYFYERFLRWLKFPSRNLKEFAEQEGVSQQQVYDNSHDYRWAERTYLYDEECVQKGDPEIRRQIINIDRKGLALAEKRFESIAPSEFNDATIFVDHANKRNIQRGASAAAQESSAEVEAVLGVIQLLANKLSPEDAAELERQLAQLGQKDEE